MRHCVLITAYKDVDLLNRLISRLPADWGVYVHLDKKSDIKDEQIDKRATLIERRKVYWGSFVHVEVFLTMMRLAHEKGDYDYYHLITGQDYPCYNLRKADDLFIGNNIFLEYFSVPNQNWEVWESGLSFFKYLTAARWMDVRRNVFTKAINRVLKIAQYFRRDFLPTYPIYGSTIYCSLPNYAVDYILSSEMTKDLSKRLKYSLVGEEVFFQTILLNSPFRDRVVNCNLRYIDWNSDPAPKTLDECDFEAIKTANVLFCRKVKKTNLLSLIDKYILLV